jgi:hypothetical protein
VLHIDDARRKELAAAEVELKRQHREIAEERRQLREDAAVAMQQAKAKASKDVERLKSELSQLKRAGKQVSKIAAKEKKKIELSVQQKLETRYGGKIEKLEQERDRANQRQHRDAGMWKNKFEELQRRAEARDRVHHGPDGEAELESVLRRQFRGDDIQRLGRRGDVIQTVLENGLACGKIIYECKRTTIWQAAFLRQLKRAMEVHETRYGVLVSRALPPRQSGLCIIDGVIVTAPDLAHHIAAILRDLIIELSRVNLSEERKREKTHEVYRYLRSEEFKSAMHSIETRTTELRTSLEREKSSHDGWWQLREQHYGAIARQSAGISTRIHDILSTSPERRLTPVTRLRP